MTAEIDLKRVIDAVTDFAHDVAVRTAMQTVAEANARIERQNDTITRLSGELAEARNEAHGWRLRAELAERAGQVVDAPRSHSVNLSATKTYLIPWNAAEMGPIPGGES